MEESQTMEEWSEGTEPKKFTVVYGGRDLLAPAALRIVTKEQERGQVPTVWMRPCSPTASLCVARLCVFPSGYRASKTQLVEATRSS